MATEGGKPGSRELGHTGLWSLAPASEGPPLPAPAAPELLVLLAPRVAGGLASCTLISSFSADGSSQLLLGFATSSPLGYLDTP